MSSFAPGLFDKLMGGNGRANAHGIVTRLTLEELKDTVARDLESLLNTRAVIEEEILKPFPECGKSIVAYGLNDFAGLSLASTEDRAHICRCLEESIDRHEPRLRNVQASLELQDGSINRLNFAITAMLVVNTAQEPVNFDAVLQPSTLQYSISKSRNPVRIGL